MDNDPITICAWCRVYLHGHGNSESEINYGICISCRERELAEFIAAGKRGNRNESIST